MLSMTLMILHQIGDTFGISNPGELSWLIAGYSLTVGTFILFTGRLGDLFGYKRMLIIGYAWFAVWSMVAGVSVYSNKVLFIFARVLQGVGPSILLPNALAIFGATYAPGLRKNMVFAIFGACAPNGSVLGSAIAGLFNLAWWPWAFWFFAILCAVLVVLAAVVVPDPPQRHRSELTLREKVRQLDLEGAAVGVTALVLFNFAWNQAPVVGWQQAYVYVLLIISVLLVPVFFYIEYRVAPAPLIPFKALTSDVAFVLACVGCGWACFGIWFYYSIQFFQVLRGTTPILTVAYVSPVCVSGAAAAIFTGYFLGKIGPACMMTIALVFFTVGTIVIATAPVHQTYWAQSFVSMVLTPWGMDMSFPAATVILSNAVPKKQQGIGASLVNTVVNYSISIGLGIAGTVEVHVNRGGRTDADLLKGYRSAEYLGIGLAGLGIAVSLVYVAKSCPPWHKKNADGECDGSDSNIEHTAA